MQDLKPDIEGQFGRAWRLAKFEGLAVVSCWYLNAPEYHPFWRDYRLIAYKLAPEFIEGGKPLMYLDGATHEMNVYALDPEWNLEKTLDAHQFHVLQPCNFAAQFIATDDEGVATRLRESVQRICDGQLSPDTDFRKLWEVLWGDNMVKGRSK